MISIFRSGIVFAFFAVFSSCTTPGAKEFEVYETSFSTAFELGQSILDRLAVKEREAFDLTVPNMTSTNAYFDPSEARFLVDAIDPPGTAALRETLKIVQLYNASLSGLASGESAQLMSERITAIGTAATSLGLQLSTPTSASQAQVIQRLADKTQPLRALEPLTNLALASATRAEFRERLLDEANTIESTVALIEITGNSGQSNGNNVQIPAGSRACAQTVEPSIFCMLLAAKLFEKDGPGNDSLYCRRNQRCEQHTHAACKLGRSLIKHPNFTGRSRQSRRRRSLARKLLRVIRNFDRTGPRSSWGPFCTGTVAYMRKELLRCPIR